MRSQFDKMLYTLNQKMVELSELVENAIFQTFIALENQDVTLAKSVIDQDIKINAKETEIETMCLNLLLQQHPVASDFRTITAILKSITDIERIGDYAVNISESIINLANKDYIIDLKYIPKMSKVVKKMVTDSINSYLKKDLGLAHMVIAQDDEVDEYMVKIREKLIALIHETKETGEQAMEFYLIARFLERIGDHATNIAEWVEFMITGIHTSE